MKVYMILKVCVDVFGPKRGVMRCLASKKNYKPKTGCSTSDWIHQMADFQFSHRFWRFSKPPAQQCSFLRPLQPGIQTGQKIEFSCLRRVKTYMMYFDQHNRDLPEKVDFALWKRYFRTFFEQWKCSFTYVLPYFASTRFWRFTCIAPAHTHTHTHFHFIVPSMHFISTSICQHFYWENLKIGVLWCIGGVL